jgi:hypothetical protein
MYSNVISRNEQHTWGTQHIFSSCKSTKKIYDLDKLWRMLALLISIFVVYLHIVYYMLDRRRFCFFHPMLFLFCFDMLCGGGCLVEERSVGVSFLFARKIF